MEDSNLAIVLILTVGLGLASILGYLARRLKLPTILGYLLTGYLIGPYSPGFVADITVAEQLAEVGVVLMLFGVGLHFKLQDLADVQGIALPGAALQTFVAAAFTTGFLYAFGWTLEAGLIMGFATGVASTVVLVRVLSDNHLLKTKEGHIAVGWLVVEDLFTVIILVLLPTLAVFSAGEHFSILPILWLIVLVLAKFVVLALFMFTWGHRFVEYILISIARLRSQELFILTVLALMFTIAIGSSVLLGTSIALGAFIAGMVIGKTSVRHQAASNALPFKDIFAVIFFLTMGMLFNPNAIVDHFLLFLGITAVVLIAKPLAAYFIAYVKGYSFKVAFTVALSLAQIGEFSFILAEEAMSLGLLPELGFDILVAVALVSISINPLLFQFIDSLAIYVGKFSKKSRSTVKKLSQLKSPFRQKVLIVGFGPIGRSVAEIVKKNGFSPVIIETNIDTVAELEEEFEILFGDASESVILKEAHIEEANYLIITIPNTNKNLEIIDSARYINPDIQVVSRVRYIRETAQLDELDVYYVCTEEEALEEFMELIPDLLQS